MSEYQAGVNNTSVCIMPIHELDVVGLMGLYLHPYRITNAT